MHRLSDCLINQLVKKSVNCLNTLGKGWYSWLIWHNLWASMKISLTQNHKKDIHDKPVNKCHQFEEYLIFVISHTAQEHVKCPKNLIVLLWKKFDSCFLKVDNNPKELHDISKNKLLDWERALGWAGMGHPQGGLVERVCQNSEKGRSLCRGSLLGGRTRAGKLRKTGIFSQWTSHHPTPRLLVLAVHMDVVFSLGILKSGM